MYPIFITLACLVSVLAVSPTVRVKLAQATQPKDFGCATSAFIPGIGLLQVLGAVIAVHGDHWRMHPWIWLPATLAAVILLPIASAAVATMIPSRVAFFHCGLQIAFAITTAHLFMLVAFS